MYDAVIVGASLAGCTTAMRLARCGWKVALLERSPRSDHHKKLCTHFIQPSAIPVLDSLGLADAMDAAGGVRTDMRLCTPWGWIEEPETEHRRRGINLARSVLDPLIRHCAASQAGVEYHAGANVEQLLTGASGRIQGVAARVQGTTQTFQAPLVVAADGRNSTVAKLANLPTHCSDNHRFSYFTYYDGALLTAGGNANFWHLESRLAFAYENGDGTSLLGLFLPAKAQADFRKDPAANFRAFWDSVPGAPDIGSARPITELRGYVSYPNQSRPAAIPGLALVGDATMSVDPMWAAGLAFAVLSADRLVAALTQTSGGDAYRTERAIDRALRSYQRHQARATRTHYWQIASFSRRRCSNWFERFIFSAAVHDRRIAQSVFAMIRRVSSPVTLATPANLWRTSQVHLKQMLGLFATKGTPQATLLPAKTLSTQATASVPS